MTFQNLNDMWRICVSSISMILSVNSIYLFIQFLMLKMDRKLLVWTGIITFINLVFLQSLANYSISLLGGHDVDGLRYIIGSIDVFYIVVIYISIAVNELLLYINLLKKRKIILNTNSIKESLDFMPEGICFSSMDGTPLLVNTKMHEISDELFGEIVLNTNICDKKLKDNEVEDGITIIRSEPDYIVKSKDCVWNIKHKFHGNIKEVIATDITEIYRLTEEIEEKNHRLEAINKRLKEYNKRVDEYTRDKEILAAKIRVHDDIGRSLLAFRAYMNKYRNNREELIELWSQSISLMKGEAQNIHEPDDWENLNHAAKQVGVLLVLKGEIPKQKPKRKIVIDIIHECLNNMVRHAGGRNLSIILRENKDLLELEITNDGMAPKTKIVEKGGLSNLRKSVEMIGGSMVVESFPNFVLRASIPGEAE